jgi:hypothetical protein
MSIRKTLVTLIFMNVIFSSLHAVAEYSNKKALCEFYFYNADRLWGTFSYSMSQEAKVTDCENLAISKINQIRQAKLKYEEFTLIYTFSNSSGFSQIRTLNLKPLNL